MSDQQEVERDAIVLPEFESRIEAAKSRGANDEEMQSLSDEYQTARQKEYDRRNKSEDSDSGPEPDEKLTGDALNTRAAELDIEGRSEMTADEKRAAVAEAEENQSEEDPNSSPSNTFPGPPAV